MRKFIPYLLLFLFISCQNGLHIEKRRYLKGHHISWTKKRHAKEIKSSDNDIQHLSGKQITNKKPKKEVSTDPNVAKENTSPVTPYPENGIISNSTEHFPVTPPFKFNKPSGLSDTYTSVDDLNLFDPFIAGSLLMLSLLGGMYFLPRLRFTRRLAGYGARNPKIAISVSAGLAALLLPLSVYTGSSLYDMDIRIPDWFNGFALAGLLGGVFFYPESSRNGSDYFLSFLRRKTCDAGIMIGAALMMMSYGNDPGKTVISQVSSPLQTEINDTTLCDSVKTLILSESVGSRIDSLEKQDYRLFPYWKQDKFEYAEICKKDDGTYVLLGKMKSGSIEQIQMKESDIQALRDQVARHDSGNADPKITVSPTPKPNSHEKYIKRDTGSGTKTLLTILSLILIVGLAFGVIAITCALSCEGYVIAAVLVGIGGAVGVIALAVAMIRAVFKRKNPSYMGR